MNSSGHQSQHFYAPLLKKMLKGHILHQFTLFSAMQQCIQTQINITKRLIHKNSNHTLYVNCNCDCIMAFLANSTFILQISHAKTFKMRYTRCWNNNFIWRYSQFHFMYGSNFYESDVTKNPAFSKLHFLHRKRRPFLMWKVRFSASRGQ